MGLEALMLQVNGEGYIRGIEGPEDSEEAKKEAPRTATGTEYSKNSLHSFFLVLQ